ncbi:AIM24 family protein [uncultured Methanobrevibacter sp.]|mgnify:CR=1 FL=1|uniref:AIM24 family protein n=1 Tax=uncultured Methanobrevibacter sp. TaxID=253161 RepID=UPI00262B77DE
MTNIYCTNCGEQIDEDSEFCTNCGTKVNKIMKYPFSGNGMADERKNTNTKKSDPNPKSSFTESRKTNNFSKSKFSRDSNIKISNFIGENDNIKVVDEKGPFTVIEYEKDLSVTPADAMMMYFSSKMNIRPRQLVADLSKTSGICLQSGSLQWMSGSNKLSSGIKGVTDFGKKYVKSKVTGESAVKPEYAGDGYVVTDKTYKHILLLNLDDFNNNLMIDDGLFLAAEKSVHLTIKARTNFSSAIAANEGLFNTVLEGKGYVCLESRVPFKEIIVIELNNDTLSIDGSMAIAWTSTLELTVEKSAKTLVGSAISREGFVNVYRGTGKILIAPLTDIIDFRDLPQSDPVNHGVAHMIFK